MERWAYISARHPVALSRYPAAYQPSLRTFIVHRRQMLKRPDGFQFLYKESQIVSVRTTCRAREIQKGDLNLRVMSCRKQWDDYHHFQNAIRWPGLAPSKDPMRLF